MALVARIAEVNYVEQVENEEGETRTNDLSLQGRLFVRAEYVDTTNPNNVLLEQRFEVSQSMSEAEIQETILSYGRRVRDARVRASELQAHVGALIPLD